VFPECNLHFNLFVKAILMCHCCFQILQLFHVYRGFISSQYIAILSCILVARCGLTLSLFLYLVLDYPISFCGTYVFTKYINIVSLGQQLMCSVQLHFLLIFLDFSDGIF